MLVAARVLMLILHHRFVFQVVYHHCFILLFQVVYHHCFILLFQEVYHQCGLCGSLLLLDSDAIASHLKVMDGGHGRSMSYKDYMARFMTSKIKNSE